MQNASILAGKRELSPPAPAPVKTPAWSNDPDGHLPVVSLPVATLLLRMYAGLAADGRYTPMDRRPALFGGKRAAKQKPQAVPPAAGALAGAPRHVIDVPPPQAAGQTARQLLLFAVQATGGVQ